MYDAKSCCIYHFNLSNSKVLIISSLHLWVIKQYPEQVKVHRKICLIGIIDTYYLPQNFKFFCLLVCKHRWKKLTLILNVLSWHACLYLYIIFKIHNSYTMLIRNQINVKNMLQNLIKKTTRIGKKFKNIIHYLA